MTSYELEECTQGADELVSAGWTQSAPHLASAALVYPDDTVDKARHQLTFTVCS